MMTTLHMPANRVLLRRARRLAWRSPGRTLWTGLLVAVAVAVGVELMAVSWGHHARTSSTDRAFGAADALYTASGVRPSDVEAATASVRAAAPGSPVALEQETAPALRIPSKVSGTAHGAPVWASARMADWTDPLLDGVIDFVAGGLPGPGDVVITPMLAQQTGLARGDRLTLEGSTGSFDVVGIATVGNWGDLSFAALPGALDPVTDPAVDPAADPAADPADSGTAAISDLRYYVGRPEVGTAAQMATVAPGSAGPAVEGPIYRDAAAVGLPADAFPTPATRIGVGASTIPAGPLVGVLVAVVVAVGVLAGAAFGIGASRRMRATGLLSANGADRGQLSMAAAAEALVVAAPAAAVGVVAAWAVRPLWVGLRLPGWTSIVDAALPWPLVVLALVIAVVAAAGGAVMFSRPVRRLSSSALLDGRTGGAPRAGDGAGANRIGWLGWLGLAMFAWVSLYAVVGLAGVVIASRTFVGVAASAAMIVLWLVCAFAALRIVRLFLVRDPVGRLVDRDLRRRRIGSTATVLVVATWVFVAVGATATDWFRTGPVAQSSVADDTTSSAGPASDPGPVSTTVVAGPTTVAGTPTTAAGTPVTAPVPAASGTALLAPRDAPTGSSDNVGWNTSGWVIAGAEQVEQPELPTNGPGVSARIVVELADHGLTTRPATVGRWTGTCTVCPDGFVPTVLVLDSAQALGLPQSTVELLESGAAVTSYAMDDVESQTVAGVPVRVGDVPVSVSAIILASAVRDGSQLTDTSPALVGDASDLDASESAAVNRIAADAGLAVDSRSVILNGSTYMAEGGAVAAAPSDWVVWPWLAFLVLVTLVATAAHRREHTEAARVLSVLGAGPRAGRRLSSLTAGSLAGVGVALGLTASFVVLAVAAVRHATSAFADDREAVLDGLWTRQATWVLLAALAVPFVVALLARLIPPARSSRNPYQAMPA